MASLLTGSPGSDGRYGSRRSAAGTELCIRDAVVRPSAFPVPSTSTSVAGADVADDVVADEVVADEVGADDAAADVAVVAAAPAAVC